MTEMPIVFAKADALLITLKNDPVFQLTVPAKLQAYMACGRPIVASIDGEGAEIIQKSKAGFVSPTEDSAALAQNILTLHHMHSSVRESMGQNGRKHYLENFSREKLFDQVNDLFSETVKK